MGMRIRVFPVIMLVLLASNAGAASFRDYLTLKGVTGVEVVVEGIDAQYKELGITAESIRVIAESKLRNAGIRVLGDMESTSAPGMPYLNINMTLLKKMFPNNEMLCIYECKLEFKQAVLLQREPSNVSIAPTWDVSSIGAAGKAQFAATVEGTIEKHMDKFCSEFVKANPKK